MNNAASKSATDRDIWNISNLNGYNTTPSTCTIFSKSVITEREQRRRTTWSQVAQVVSIKKSFAPEDGRFMGDSYNETFEATGIRG